ncbi:MAG TPA: phosphatase PAP2 family protein [Steroidobacteraceae bacterium]|nr:phosphatase PAP2 family protein [Steroidobacteraceae bacterium]
MTAVELPLCLMLNRWGSRSFVHGFFATVSRLGDGMFWYALMTALAVLGGARGALAALHMALTGLGALALYKGLKRHIRRPRPCAAGRGIVALVAPLDQFSFPSGHTLHAVAFTAVASAWFPVLALPLLPFAALVALSRVVLGLHYPSDVLAAIAIGLALAGVSLSLA